MEVWLETRMYLVIGGVYVGMNVVERQPYEGYVDPEEHLR